MFQAFLQPNNYKITDQISFINVYGTISRSFPKPDFQQLSLRDLVNESSFFENMPKTFTISTNNGSCNFNVEMLRDSSETIKERLLNNPTNLEFHLDIDDENNVLKKFEQLYQGKIINIPNDDVSTYSQIKDILNIDNIPNLSLSNYFNTNDVTLDKVVFYNYLQKNASKSFYIVTKKKRYSCTSFGILSSKVIRDIISENPSENIYQYDIEDEFNEFQDICDLFNFKDVTITPNNMDILKEVFEDLQIDFLSQKINDYIESYEKVSSTIDDEQSLIEPIDQLFDLLYKINEKNISTTVDSILKSNWVRTKSSVLEFAAFFLQVVKTDFLLQDSLLEMLIQLDSKSSESNELNVLLPCVVKKLMDSFGDDKHNCSFIYKLRKKGIVSEEEVMKNVKKNFMITVKPDNNNNNNRFGFGLNNGYRSNTNIKKINMNVCEWFLPEVSALSDISYLLRSEFNGDETEFMINSLENIEKYKKMLDNGEPDDVIILALRNDDVDLLQSLINQKQISIERAFVPFNIYEDFILNGQTKYIDYAAAYGSIKCFKFLLLNHAEITKFTFSYAVYGGNSEIVKIVHQSNELFDDDDDDTNNNNNNRVFGPGFFGMRRSQSQPKQKEGNIVPSITKHRNDLFDWILETKYKTEKKIETKFKPNSWLDYIAEIAAKNGNAHALISIFDSGFDLSSNKKKIFEIVAQNGYYHLLQFLYNILYKNEHEDSYIIGLDLSKFYSFRSLPIFAISTKLVDNLDVEKTLPKVIENDCVDIVHFYFDTLVKEGLNFSLKGILESLNVAASGETTDIFYYLLDQLQKNEPEMYENIDWKAEILPTACYSHNFDIVKTVIDLILKEPSKKEEDFTLPFFNAAVSGSFESCQYMVEKKLYINYEQLSDNVHNLMTTNGQVLLLILENSSDRLNKIILNNLLVPAINKKSVELVDSILKEMQIRNMSLYQQHFLTAVETMDVDIVKTILKYNKEPRFINALSKKGSGLTLAVLENNLPLVQLLLSIPGIDIDLLDYRDLTAIEYAFQIQNAKIICAIIDAYNGKMNPYIAGSILKQLINMFINSLKTKTNQVFQVRKFGTRNYGYYDAPKKIDISESDILAIFDKVMDIKDIDPNICCKKYNLLSFACDYNKVDMVKKLLKLPKIDPNKGMDLKTPLMIAISNKECVDYEIVKLLIKHPKTNINYLNIDNQSALSIAINYDLYEIADLIVNDEKFNEKDVNINYFFYIAKSKTSKFLLKSFKSIDVNKTFGMNDQNMVKTCKEEEAETDVKRNCNHLFKISKKADNDVYQQSKLIYVINDNDLELFNMIIQHPSFDRHKTDVEKALFTAISQNRKEMYHELIQISKDEFHTYKFNDENVFIYAILNSNNDALNDLFNSTQIKLSKEEIENCFNQSVNILIDINTDRSFDVLATVIKYDREHDHSIDINKLLPNGKTLFTSLVDLANAVEFAKFLLENGADPNIQDLGGNLPLEIAINNNNSKFVHVLIDSKKVDFNKKFQLKVVFYTSDFKPIGGINKTYLHLAARLNDPTILKELLNCKFIDVNSTD